MKKKIFVVEDESIVLLEIQERLSDLGYEVVGTCASGEMALIQIPEADPDIILMDIMLKGKLDGIETVEILKEKIETPVIYLTAYADDNTINRAKLSTPYGYIIKPFEERELHTAIEIALYKFDTEKKLKEKDEWLRTILKSIGDAVIATDTKGMINFMNEIAEDLTGYKSSEAIGKSLDNIFNIINEFSGEKVDHPVKIVLDKGNIVGLANHTALISRKGDVIPIMDTAAPIRSDKNEIIGVVLVFQDMRERKRTENKLFESEKKFKELVENSPEIIYSYSTKKGGTYYSPTVAHLLGFEPEFFERDKELWRGRIHPSDVTKYDRQIANATLNSTSIILYRIRDRKGKWKWFNDKITLVSQSKDERIIQGFASDITSNIIAEEKIALQRSALNSAYNGILITDKTGNIIWCNESISRISGYSVNEILGSNPKLFKLGHHPKVFYTEMWNKILRGEVWSGELLNKRKNGEIYYEEISITPVKNIDNEITHFISIKQDITERKNFENELISAKEEAEKSDKLKSEFLAQMSHEIRTPISSILSFTNLLKTDLADKVQDDTKISFEMIEHGGQRLIRTIDLILNMSAIQTNSYKTNFKEIDLIQTIIDPIMSEFKGAAKLKNLVLEFKNGLENGSYIWGDEYSISQIFANLVDNAIKYTDEGKISIETANESNGDLVVTIQDTGIGISGEYLPYLFQPFSQEDQGYTRKFEGNGLGLALVKNYCDINKAAISVESKKGRGSIFKLTFRK